MSGIPVRDFYPRSPCGERLVHLYGTRQHGRISIHALLAESDRGLLHHMRQARYFYPRSPCGERRATASVSAQRRCYFYPRSPCGERRMAGICTFHGFQISIHALLAESDSMPLIPTRVVLISIHALLAESDHETSALAQRIQHFYPRSPCGERPASITIVSVRALYFYPRSPCGERHAHCFDSGKASGISIHALLAESDGALFCVPLHTLTFLSTLSLRRATSRTWS